jgi:formate hydrogenlyase subunit 4
MPASWLGALAWGLLGPVLLLSLAPLLDGIGRRIHAVLQSRVGPPLSQGYLDLSKLAGKEDLVSAPNTLTAWLPYVALAATVSAGLLLPVAGRAPLGFAGDVMVVIYLLGLSTVALAVAGSATGSPYAFLGASRELLLLLFVEPVVACAFLVLALKAGTFRLDAMVAWQAAHGLSASSALAAAAVFLSLLAYLGKLPFDLSEAEQELTGGVLVEFGGRRLALFKWALFVRWLVVAWLVVEVFVPTPLPPAAGILVTVLKVLVLFAVLAALESLVARLRIQHARVFLFNVAFLIVFAIAFALIGA